MALYTPFMIAPIYIGATFGSWVQQKYNNGVLLTELILSLTLGIIIFIKPLSSSTLYIPVSAALNVAILSSTFLIGFAPPKRQLLKVNKLYFIMVISATLAFFAAIVWV